MKVWLVVDYEPIPGIDGQCRYLRYGTLATVLASRGHDVTWWTSDFDHAHKRHRHTGGQLNLQPNLNVRLLPGTGYKKNISLQRIRHNRSVANSFIAATRLLPENARPDLIVACLHTLELSEAAATYAQVNGIPFVTDVVDIWPEVYLRAFPPMLKSFARLCLRREYARARRVIGSAHTLTAVSDTYLKWALSQIQDRPHQSMMFPLGYDQAAIAEDDVNRESSKLMTRKSITMSGDLVKEVTEGGGNLSMGVGGVIGAVRSRMGDQAACRLAPGAGFEMSRRPPALFFGEALGLDFLNSIATPIDTQVDWIDDGEGLLSWLEQARLAPRDTLKSIRARAAPGEVDKVAAQARSLREWFRGFVRQHMGRPLAAEVLLQLKPLNRLLEHDEMFSRVSLPAREQQRAFANSDGPRGRPRGASAADR